jgi:uncharacterized membrane protein YcaP (DUF421 family)
MDIQWAAMFTPQHSFVELFIRGTLTYLGLFIIMRVTMRRELGSLSVADLLPIVLIAEALQNAMVPDVKSITEGLFVVLVLVFWNFVLDWMAFTFPLFERLVNPAPLLLVDRGKIVHRNMRREMITEKELMKQLRKEGVEDLKKVKTAHIEADGQISVVPFD